jgi:signal recognition particle subunit SRP54
MFGNFTQKISKFLIKRMQNSKQEEINKFVDDLLEEFNGILLNEDVHPQLVKKILEDGRQYLNANKHEIFNSKNLIKNLLKEILSKYILEDENLSLQKNIILIGDNGNGKTTVASKLAVYLSQQGKKIAVIHNDPFRYGSYEQLVENLETTNVVVYKNNEVIRENYDHYIFDTAGFSSWTKDYESTMLANGTHIFVGSCLIGNSNFLLIESILKKKSIDAIIITNCDGEARSGLFLSASHLINKPIAFITDNETIIGDGYNPAIIPFHKETLMKRLVGLYDETGFQESVEKISKKNSSLMDKLMTGVLDYETMEHMCEGMVKNKFNSLLGSMGNMQMDNPQQKLMMKKMLIMIQSMTPKEKTQMDLLDGPTANSRLNRIAKGCHMTIPEVIGLLRSSKMMINTFKNFAANGMDQLNTDNIDDLKDKFSNPDFIKQYMDEDSKNSINTNNINYNFSESNSNQYNINKTMSNEIQNGGNNLFGDNAETIRMMKKQFTPQQFVNLLRSFTPELLRSMPGMESVDPAMLKAITVEQVEHIFNSVN